MVSSYLDNPVNVELIHARKHVQVACILNGVALVSLKPMQTARSGRWRVITIELIAWPSAGDAPFEFLTYQLSMVGSGPTMVVTGNGELGFDSGEGA